jgi:hypothetical protein
MEIAKRNFPKIMRDNDELYMENLIGVIESVDELCSMEIIKTLHSFHFRIAPSIPRYTQPLLKEILKLNNVYGIHLDLGKSIRTSSTITFDIELNQ